MTASIRTRPTPWNTVLLLCGKCSRKMDGGFGEKGKETLRASLRAELKASGVKRGVRIIETRCLRLCPSGAVAALNATRPAELLTVPKGSDAPAVLARLMNGGA